MHSEMTQKRRPARVLDFSALIPRFGILFCVLVPVLFWNSCLSAPQFPAGVALPQSGVQLLFLVSPLRSQCLLCDLSLDHRFGLTPEFPFRVRVN